MRIRSWGLLSLLGLSTLAGARGLPGAFVPGWEHGPFVDAVEYLDSEEDFRAWLQLRANLRKNFDDICGDTFCEGDYSNIETVVFRCSVGQRSGVLGQCLWVFGGSYEDIDAKSGAITTEARTWACTSPLVPGTTMAALLKALSGPDPMDAPLPGTSTTLYDGLIDCL